MNDELKHYGVLGMKWGVHRYQNSDGTSTREGKAKYRTNRTAGHIGRAISNTSLGQRVIGVAINKGYRQDKKEIKEAYKGLKKNAGGISDKKARKSTLKSLKSDYRKTLGEARTTAANVLYPWQSKSANQKIQTTHFGKTFAKSMLLGGYGTKNYDTLSADGVRKGTSVAVGILSYMGNNLTSGFLSTGDYAYNASNYSKNHK